MTTRGVLLQGGLAALGLVAAYTTSQREPERAPGEVVLLEATQKDLERVRYEDGDKYTELSRGESMVWLRTSPNPNTKAPAREVRANQAGEKLFNGFAPLRATRSLGTLDAGKLKELGFEGTKKKIELTARGQKHVFQLATTPIAGSAPYLKDDRTGRVYVLNQTFVSDLDTAASRCVDRALHDFTPPEYDALTISHGGRKRELVHTSPQSPSTARLAPRSNPSRPDERAKNWHDRIWRTFVVEVLGKSETPAGGEPQVVLRIDYYSGRKPLGFVEIARSAAAPAPPPAMSSPEGEQPEQPKVDLFARSEHTVGWVKLAPGMDDVLKEAEKIISGG